MDAVQIIAIGDSITYGYPYSPEVSWFNLAAGQLNMRYANKGVNGDTSTGMLNRFNRDVVRYKPLYVTIMGGTNDVYNGSEVDQVMDNMAAMVQLALQNGITPVIGLPIPCNDSAEESLLGQCRDNMRWYAVRNGIAYIDFHKVMVDERSAEIKKGLHCDGIHPNERGYRLMAGEAVPVLARLLNEPD